MSKRGAYSPELRRKAVAVTHQPGVSCRQIALGIGIHPNVLIRWNGEADDASSRAFGDSGTPRDQELARLKRERVYHRRYRGLNEARTHMFDYVERCHNPRMPRRVATQDQGLQPFLNRL